MIFNKQLTFLLFFVLATITITQIDAQTLSEQLSSKANYTVASDGSGDYTTVKAAINAIPDNNDSWKVIFVKNGTYEEKIVLNYKKTKVILVGENVDSTIITWDDYATDDMAGHTFSTYTFRADANDFQAYNITFDNPATTAQAVAFHSNGDRQILYHCRITGNQDTYFDNFRTRRYLKDCFIEGTVDYIFGWGVTLFDSCQIHSTRDDGYITASATPQYYEFGHVFKNCRLTTTPGVSGVYLGRPWFPYANTIFYECWEPESINEDGWKAWSGREETCIYKEYNCFGPGSDTTERVDFGKQLNPDSAFRYNIDTIFAAGNFPSDLGYTADTAELMLLYRRFKQSGYAERADTILYAGRSSYPDYPTDDWSPEFYSDIYDIIEDNTVPFMDSSYSKIEITDLLWDNQSMVDFDPDSTEYMVELPSGQTDYPVFEFVGNNLITTTDYPSNMPGVATLLCTAADKTTGNEFEIYISTDSAWWNSAPEYISLNKEDTIWITDGTEHYYSGLSDDVTYISSVRVKIQYTGQKYSYEKPDELPGDVLVTVKAPNQIDSTTYTISVGQTSAIENTNYTNYTKLVVSSSFENIITLYSNTTISSPVDFRLFNISGKKVFEANQININSNRTDLNLNQTNINKGLYIYHIQGEGIQLSGKIVKIK